MAFCIVSFVDLDGITHSVQVEAGGLYEAAVLGLCALRKRELEPGVMTQIEVEVRKLRHAHAHVGTGMRVATTRRKNAQRSGSERTSAGVAANVNEDMHFSH